MGIDRTGTALQFLLTVAGFLAAYYLWLPFGVAVVGTAIFLLLLFLTIKTFGFQRMDPTRVVETEREQAADLAALLAKTHRVGTLVCASLFGLTMGLAAAWTAGPDVVSGRASILVRETIKHQPDDLIVEYLAPPAKLVLRAPTEDAPSMLVVAPAPSRKAMQTQREVRALEFRYVVSVLLGDPSWIFVGIASFIFLGALALTFFIFWMDRAFIRRHIRAAAGT